MQVTCAGFCPSNLGMPVLPEEHAVIFNDVWPACTRRVNLDVSQSVRLPILKRIAMSPGAPPRLVCSLGTINFHGHAAETQ